MSMIKKVIGSTIFAGSLFAASLANAGVIPFYLSTDGSGNVLPDEYQRLDVVGNVTVDVDEFLSATQYTFTQSASFNISSAGDPFTGLCFLQNCLFTATLEGATGIATLGGSASFTGGTITLRDTANDVDVAIFDIFDGGVGVDSTGVPVGNNPSSIIAAPTFFAENYFFFDADAELDFANENFGFNEGLRPTFLNINLTLSDVNSIFETVTLDDDTTVEQLQQVTFAANGAARFEEEVPAPATIALVGLGILGLRAIARRRRVA